MGTGGTGTGGSYPYQLKDVPELPVTKRETSRKTKITISNLAEHAAIAMDLKESEYEYPGQEPEGDIVLRGTRQSGKRGDIGTKEKDGGDNRATAPLDWLPTYIRGGKFQRSIARGIKLSIPEED